MTKIPTPDEAVARAEEVQRDRMSTIRRVASARQNLTDARSDAERRRADLERELSAQLAAAEAEDLRAYTAATSVGWSVAELRQIGFTEPAKRARRRRAKPLQRAGDAGAEGGPSDEISGAVSPSPDAAIV